MDRRWLVALLVVLPVAALAGLLAIDLQGTGRDYVVHLSLPPAAGEVGLPQVEGPLDPGRPLVVIDPGHGGFDPGAGAEGIKEKALTLSLARALRDDLLAHGGIRVALTRDDDRFLMLPERAGIARRLRADLFISIHADSAADPAASGATVYTLSERGSNQTAAELAAAENRADTVNGVQLASQSGAVNAILVDLSQREAASQSDDFARLILREGEGQAGGQGAVMFRDRSIQSAAFVVLKTADLPSILFETGYISNAADAARLNSVAGQQAFARVTASAIRAYFARHQAD